eukprot:NODE_564_length_1607_cov_78.848524_g429_i1.p1 GENE.NODE_564_length_1607_cov_78.848524_g429_i1~~NODE_564_length_1607_cov_78.848524_g429_i1.p1  ORF type:complete len:170 (-),score=52.81 NODE_564_length_1607_cov_78.848524_g429_i1:316-825(-)
MTDAFNDFSNGFTGGGGSSPWEQAGQFANQMWGGGGGGGGGGGFSLDQVGDALKRALREGVEWAVRSASSPGGFLNDERLRIGWPEDASSIASALQYIGQGEKCSELEGVLNKSAEQASGGAFDIFSDCVSGMSLADAKAVLAGDEREATKYMRNNTYSALVQMFTGTM